MLRRWRFYSVERTFLRRSEWRCEANGAVMRLPDDREMVNVTPFARVRRIPTSFPSSAEDIVAEPPLDLNALLALRPAVTFYLEMAGDALLDSGVFAGDVLVVDRSLRPVYGALVVVALDGGLLARHYCPDSAALHLLPAHPEFAPISVPVSQASRWRVWGVVTAVIHQLRR
jgi:DNA polymerase V